MLRGPLILAGCGETMTDREIDQALTAAKSAARSDQLAGEVVEISTSCALGQAAADAAEELRAWYQSQVPCSTVTRDGASLTVDFGTLDDACVYAGHTYAGVGDVVGGGRRGPARGARRPRAATRSSSTSSGTRARAPHIRIGGRSTRASRSGSTGCAPKGASAPSSQVPAALDAHGVAHRYEAFDDTHSDIDYRMDESLPFLWEAVRGT